MMLRHPGLRDALENVRRLMSSAMCSALAALWIVPTIARPQDVREFGTASKEARGERSLLVVLAEYDGSPDLSYSADEYRSLFFDLELPSALRTRRQTTHTIQSFFREASNGRFAWRGAVVGPVALGNQPGYQTDPAFRRAILQTALSTGAIPFPLWSSFDADQDGVVTQPHRARRRSWGRGRPWRRAGV